jgi:hypothetical protein
MEEMQLGVTGKVEGAGKDNMCVADELCLIGAG